ncbi:hypothetical protein CASFOL_025034 [Castilleja foliolosa]|uniref:Uncharacterized protein n=1 Tax=Castilleja foliolosa TaxID=1961234 RepID=A0ABD3CTP1_9LAMI
MYAFHLHFIFQKSGSLPNIPSLSSPFTALQVVGDLHGAFRRSISKEKKRLFSDSSRSAQRPARRPKNLECCSRLLICTSAGVIGSRHKPLQTSPKQINREELKSIEGLQLARRSCKEVTDFVTANADPLIPTTKKARRSCHFWNWLWYHGSAVVVGRLVPRYRAAVAVAVTANVTRVIRVATHVPPGVTECPRAVAGIASAAVRNRNAA